MGQSTPVVVVEEVVVAAAVVSYSSHSVLAMIVMKP
jgi:hypothetical protein